MACAYELPTLLQLSAEKVADEAIRYKTMYHVLKRMQLPNININYIEDDYICKTCDFLTYITEKLEDSKILSVMPSEPKWRQNGKYKITVGSEKTLYVSTIFNLGMGMLKLDFPEGEYELYEMYNGHVLRTKNYTPTLANAVHVFSRNRDKGFAGPFTHHYKETVQHFRILNQYIMKYLPQLWLRCMAQYVQRQSTGNFEIEYFNFPVLFYLTENLNRDELSKITLTCPTVIYNCGNIEVCWYVFHEDKGRIGIGVQQVALYPMMYDVIGVGLFASNGFRAIGNIDYSYDPMYAHVEVDGVVVQIEPDHPYQCEFDECSCDYKLDKEVTL